MAQHETLAKVKHAIRRSHNMLDDDLMADIDACLADLKVCGVNGPQATEDDPLIYNAIKLYCKSLDTDDPARAAEWRQRYDSLKSSLMMADGYGNVAEDGGADG